MQHCWPVVPCNDKVICNSFSLRPGIYIFKHTKLVFVNCILHSTANTIFFQIYSIKFHIVKCAIISNFDQVSNHPNFLKKKQQQLLRNHNYNRMYINGVKLHLSHCLAFSVNAHWHAPVFTSAELLFNEKHQFAIKLTL